jgi:hypothetical protein
MGLERLTRSDDVDVELAVRRPGALGQGAHRVTGE